MNEHSPIFIVGSPRSGTTLLRGVLDAHPNIMCPPCETFLFERYDAIFNGNMWKSGYSKLALEREELLGWYREHFISLFRMLKKHTLGKNRFCEKTPIHVEYIDFILQVFPRAKLFISSEMGSSW